MRKRCLAWLAVGVLGCSPAPKTRVIVLALDGCDPVLLSRYIEQGRLPNFARLRKQGRLSPLGTTNPPQSPVAWATFVTGVDPGGHGLFDFLHRDPKRLEPITSMSSVVDGQARSNRGGPPFWKYLSQHGVPATLLRVPCEFPASNDGSRCLTGLGTPDLLGSYGTFTVYSQGPHREVRGGNWVPVEVDSGVARASLIGPEERSLPLRIVVDAVHEQALLGVDQQSCILKKGEWSEWLTVDFDGVPGIVRFHLSAVQPLRLYASPINIDPAQPVQAICNPPDYAPHLSRCCGSFYTQAMAEETKALSEKLLNDEEYLEQSRLVLAENRRLLKQGLSEFKSGLFFFYLSHIDLQCHMFWDESRPDNHPVVQRAYADMDEVLGEVLQAADGKTTVWVVSDHGFAPFRRVFDLNGWLAENGWLRLETGQGMEKIDWENSRAYGLGFNGLYLNLAGRESKGTVSAAQREQILDQLAKQLLEVRDHGEPVIREVYRAEKVYSPTYLAQAPDLVVGYRRGYRVSWETALGGRAVKVLSDNDGHWCGDHLIDPREVPGVLMCSRPFQTKDPQLQDLAPTLLDQFGIARPGHMPGQVIR